MKNQDRYYTNVMPDYYRKLKTFREYYPSKKAEINGTEWEYIDRKKGSETVLFLSGATRTGETNINNLIRYKNRFRIISPSYPPLGNFNALVEGIRTILDREGVGMVHKILLKTGKA